MFKTKIGNLDLETCIYNASGVYCVSFDELLKLAAPCFSNSVILTKSCTLEPRIGNNLPRYYDTELLSINSSGLPNLGYKFYCDNARIIKDHSEFKKPYILSISGLTLEDNYKIITEAVNNNFIDGIELNLSCPNVIGKPQVGYDFTIMEEIIRNASEIIETGRDVRLESGSGFLFGLKLPPYFDISHFGMACDIINNSNVQSLTCINSIGNGLVIDTEKELVAIAPKNGYGGIGGTVIKPTALANVHYFYRNTKCSIIGCGGISSGMDAFEHILCGASAVQIGTHFHKKRNVCFKEILTELGSIMKSKNYKTIDDFRGKLVHYK